MADITVDRSVDAPAQNLITITHVMYALHGFSALMGVLSAATVITAFLFGWPSIIAVIINYVKRDEVRGTWLDSHFSWQLRTFWYAVLWAVVAFVLAITLVGIVLAVPVAFALTIWIVYRVIRGWMTLSQGKPIVLKK
ncbi:MAG TPA: hypothetical protein VHP37_02565 [Burkholderiales bacterium]|nr:hypothetical protein [Burkholderiales bacterium]